MHMMKWVNVLALTGALSMAAHASEPAMQGVLAGECWVKAMKGGDVDAVAGCYLPDAVMWFPGGGMAKGRDAIRKGYADYFSAYRIKDASLEEMGHVAAGDAMTTWGRFTIVMVSTSDGTTITEHGHFTDVSRKVGGRWMYAVDNATDDPERK